MSFTAAMSDEDGWPDPDQKGWEEADEVEKNYFGFNGKPMESFAKELKELSHEEKIEFHKMLNEAGVACDEPMVAKTV